MREEGSLGSEGGHVSSCFALVNALLTISGIEGFSFFHETSFDLLSSFNDDTNILFCEVPQGQKIVLHI